LPENFTSGRIDGQEDPLFLFQERGNGEDLIPKDDGGSMTGPGNLGFPKNIARSRPVPGEAPFQARAIAARSAPPWPVFSAGLQAKVSQEEQQNSAAHPKHIHGDTIPYHNGSGQALSNGFPRYVIRP
jgi:hypothetical protein